ncbi:MFS transporter [Streptomyces sp. NPDC002790]|uniref:MFS transporter n=1 Tax=Streptomyces sp. NPDC002790 TaxID=3154431 RepID=UPI003330F8E5
MAAGNGVGAIADSGRWYRNASKAQWRSFWAAYMGWMLDIMDLMIFSMVITYIVQDFHTNQGVTGLIASFTLVASAFGGMVFGYLADRFGRTKAMVGSILCYSVGTLLCGLTTGVATLMIARLIVGLGIGGEWGAGTALLSETWPARHRDKVIAWVQSAFATGYALAAVVTLAVVPALGWRWAFFVGVLPAALAFWIRRGTEEPKEWLESGERLSFGQSVRRLFVDHRRPVVACMLFTTLAMFGYWGLFTWIPNYLSTPAADGGRGMDILASTTWIVIMQVGAGVGFVSFGYVADRIGRRNAFILYFVLAAICVPIFFLITNQIAMLVFGAVMALFGTGFYSGFGPTFAQLFPTEVRAFAQGFIYNAGRAISALAPAVVGFLAESSGPALAMTGTAIFYVLAAVVVFFYLPRARRSAEARGGDIEPPVTSPAH